MSRGSGCGRTRRLAGVLLIYRIPVFVLNLPTAIQSFKCEKTRELFESGKCRQFANVATVATRKLQMLDSAATLDFLRSPPGNRLEPLIGSREGQHSIRVNDQWRVCFIWTALGPIGVEIVDYH